MEYTPKGLRNKVQDEQERHARMAALNFVLGVSQHTNIPADDLINLAYRTHRFLLGIEDRISVDNVVEFPSKNFRKDPKSDWPEDNQADDD